jgi:glucose-6-phosphate-specific signal transduction histidine kinase
MLPPDSDANKSGVAFVLTDLDVALTFMDVADGSGIRETVLRNHKNARTAYDSVLRLLGKLAPDVLQQLTIDEKLAILKKRLLAAGQQF